jgi:hypothetical protein
MVREPPEEWLVSEVRTMDKEDLELRYLDDGCREEWDYLSATELSRLAFLAEHPELENPTLAKLRAGEPWGWGQ